MEKGRQFMVLLFVQFTIVFTAIAQQPNERFTTSVARAAIFLKQAQLPSGAIQDSTNPLFNVWETVLVADALLDHFPETDTSIAKALSWLEANQNAQQLVCHNEKCRENYCIETSALYLQLLWRLQNKPDLFLPLQTIRNLQQTNGSWEVGNPDVHDQKDFPSVTAFALRLFYTTSHTASPQDPGYVYLRNHQLKDGSFGQAWEYYNCPGYALWQCIPALRVIAPSGSEEQIKALDFIVANQLSDGSWNAIDPTIANRVSPQLQTAFMLSCLTDTGSEKYQAAFDKGMQFLLDTQLPNGAWDGGFFPIPNARYKKREYLMATALIYKLLIGCQKMETHE